MSRSRWPNCPNMCGANEVPSMRCQCEVPKCVVPGLVGFPMWCQICGAKMCGAVRYQICGARIGRIGLDMWCQMCGARIGRIGLDMWCRDVVPICGAMWCRGAKYVVPNVWCRGIPRNLARFGGFPRDLDDVTGHVTRTDQSEAEFGAGSGRK